MPTPIETQLLDYVRTRLRLIKTTNGYDFPVGQNVFMYEVDVGQVVTPCCAVVRRASILDLNSGSGEAQVNLQFQVGFVHAYKQDNPHAVAALFVENILRAIPVTTNVAVTRADETAGTLAVAFLPSNAGATNITVPVAGRVHGQVDYTAAYKIALVRDGASWVLDPRRIP